MIFTWDFNTATLVAIGVQIILGIGYMVRTDNKAKSALGTAKHAIKSADEAHDKIAVLHGLLGLHQTQVAKEYVDKDALREMKDDLMNSINRLSDRIDEALHKPHR